MSEQELLDGYSFDDVCFKAKLTLQAGRSSDELETSCKKAMALARHKLSVLLSEGRISVFEIHENIALQLARRLASVAEGRNVTFTIAAGAPALDGLSFDFSTRDGSALGSVIVDAPVASLAAWRPMWLTLLARQSASAKKQEDEIVPAQLEAILLRAQAGAFRGRAEPLIRRSRLLSISNNGRSLIGSIKHIGDTYVIIRSASRLVLPETLRVLLNQVRGGVIKRTIHDSEPIAFRILLDDLTHAFEAAIQGPQSLGIELPLILLGAVALPLLSNEIENGRNDNLAFYLEVAKALASLPDFSPRRAKEVPIIPFFRPDSHEAFAKAISLLEQSSWVEQANSPDAIRIASDVIMAPFFTGKGTVRASYREALRLANEAVDDVAESRGGIYAISLCLSDHEGLSIRRRLEEAWEELLLSPSIGKSGDQIYQVMLQFLPITRRTAIRKTPPNPSDSTEVVAGTEWCKLVLREMVGLEDFRSDPEWIVAKLLAPISKHAVSSALAELKRAGMVREDRLGRLVQINRNLSTEDEVGGEAVVKYHRSMIMLTNTLLSLCPIEQRFFAGTSLWVSESMVADFRSRLVSVLRDIYDLANSRSRGDQIYQLNAQLFPLTRGSVQPPSTGNLE